MNRAGWFQPLGSGGSDGWVRRQANRLNTRALAVLDKVGLGTILVSIIILGPPHNCHSGCVVCVHCQERHSGHLLPGPGCSDGPGHRGLHGGQGQLHVHSNR